MQTVMVWDGLGNAKEVPRVPHEAGGGHYIRWASTGFPGVETPALNLEG